MIDTKIDVGVQDALGRAPAGHRHLADLRERHARRLRPALGRLRRGRRGGLRPLGRKRCGQGGKPQGKKKGEEGARSALRGASLPPSTRGSKKKSGGAQARSSSSAGSRPAPIRRWPPSTPKRRQLVWVSARGLGVGPNPNGPNPNTGDDNLPDQYLPSIVDGDSGVLTYPSDRKIRKLTPVSDRQVVPDGRALGAGRTPRSAPSGPIKHVFYIVRENRTYDQVLGDDSRGDGDPALTLFGNSITPNLHALVQRFPLLDHVYANSEASIDGHYWTAAGAVSDYVTKNWHQNYAGRNRPYDFGAYDVSAPPKGYIFQRMLESGVSFYNYGEALAGISPFPDRDRTPEQTAENAQVLYPTRTDVQVVGGCYDSDISIFDTPAIGPKVGNVYDSSLPPGSKPGDASRFNCFNSQVPGAGGDQLGPDLQLPLTAAGPHRGACPRQAHPGRRHRQQRLGPRPDRRRDLALLDLEQLPDPGGRGRFPERRRPRRRPSHPRARDQPLHPAGGGGPRPLRPALVPADARDHLGPAVGESGEALAVPLYDAVTPNPGNSAPYNAIVAERQHDRHEPRDRARTSPPRRTSHWMRPTRCRSSVLDAMLWHYRHGFGSTAAAAGPERLPCRTARGWTTRLDRLDRCSSASDAARIGSPSDVLPAS